MTLQNDDVKRVASLAKLDLTDGEITKFGKQLSSVVDYVKQLDEVDTKDTDPTSQTTGLLDVTRKDIVKPEESLPVAGVLSGTENTLNDYFVVPAVINKDES